MTRSASLRIWPEKQSFVSKVTTSPGSISSTGSQIGAESPDHLIAREAVSHHSAPRGLSAFRVRLEHALCRGRKPLQLLRGADRPALEVAAAVRAARRRTRPRRSRRRTCTRRCRSAPARSPAAGRGRSTRSSGAARASAAIYRDGPLSRRRERAIRRGLRDAAAPRPARAGCSTTTHRRGRA